MDVTALFASRSNRMRASEIRELLKLLDQPDIISFAGGIPDPALFPHEAFRRAYAKVLARSETNQALQYQASEGYVPLRVWIASEMRRIGVPCDEGNIFITSGSQQGLDYLGKLFLSPGDTVLVTYPTYLGALQAFNVYEPNYDRLRLDLTERAAPDAARATAIRDGRGRTKFAYVVPDFANPTGETLELADRRALLDMAEDMDIAIIEDSAYRALRYSGEPIAPVLALDCERSGGIEMSRTIFCGSFSKTLSPGLRVGWICAPKRVVDKLVLIKQASDLHSPSLNQMAILEVAAASFDNQISRVRTVYGARRDGLLAALKAHMPNGVSWTGTDGGMFVWVTLPRGIDTAALLARSVREARVAFVPGGAFHPDGSGTNTLRMSFSLADERALEIAIPKLARMIGSELEREAA